MLHERGTQVCVSASCLQFREQSHRHEMKIMTERFVPQKSIPASVSFAFTLSYMPSLAPHSGKRGEAVPYHLHMIDIALSSATAALAATS